MARTKASLRGHPGPAKAREQLLNAQLGVAFLKEALKCFVASDNQQTAARVRYALSSAYGAVRICQYRTVRLDAKDVERVEKERDSKFRWATEEDLNQLGNTFREGARGAEVVRETGVALRAPAKKPSK